MADVKISQLPAATTPLDGTELTPIVQSGTTKRVSVANLTVGRALTASSLTLSTPLLAANGGTGLTSLGTGIATFLGTPTSANLAAAVTDETGTGALVFGTTPTFTTSALFPAGTVGAPGISVSGDTNTGIYFPAADTIGFVEGGVESMRLDASGNLGLGVTPSAWNAGTAIQLQDAVSYSRYGQARNAYFDGSNWRYITTATTTWYLQAAGAHSWWNAPSGTAGNAISFTQAMTLNASGFLGIGANATTPIYLTDIVSGSGSVNIFRAGQSGVSNGYTITSNGSALTHIWSYSGSEAMRIDTSGNLLVGQSSTASPGIGNTTTGIALSGTYISASRNGDYSYYANRNSSDGGIFWFGRQGSFIGSISITTTAVAYNTTSDISLKENIFDAKDALQSILSIPIRQFDWKNGNHTDYGVVAQEIVEYAPEIVSKEDLWAVDYGRITPRLIKAFQELAAKVSALEARQ